MENLIVMLVVAIIVGCAAGYIYKSKKQGVKCIGCPSGGKCSGNCSCCSGSDKE